jgi:AcrR family transcriptional regulator
VGRINAARLESHSIPLPQVRAPVEEINNPHRIPCQKVSLTVCSLIVTVTSMSRPKSEEKRNAIMAAATRVIVTHGLSASTAMIAQEAGVANGSLFTYFETKVELFNQLYLELKIEMASAALKGFPAGAELRKQMFHVWSNWVGWAVSHPEKRRALTQLGVSDEITSASRAAAHRTMAVIAELLERARAKGPMGSAPMEFVVAILNSLADATMDYMIQDPTNAKRHCKVGFEALWRVIA